MLKILLLKYFTEKASVLKRDRARLDLAGNIMSVILACSLIAVGVIVFSRFITMYAAIRIDNVLDVGARQFELLTWVYAALFVFGVISGVKAINYSIFENNDRVILLTLPIKANTIFYSKLIILYLKQIVVFLFTLLPINLTFAVVAEQSVYYILMTILLSFLFPLITLAFSSVFCLPVYYLKRFIQSKYTFMLILITVITAVVFWGYSALLDGIKTMLTTGEIRFFFKETTMQMIIGGAKVMYPSNLIAGLLLKRNIAVNLSIIIALAATVTAIGFIIVNLIFNKANQQRVINSGRVALRNNQSITKKSSFISLVIKEFNLVLRTPSYAFQYFSVAAIMPLMVYLCMGIGSNLLENLVFTNNNFELAMFVVLLFATLTNTFCATNISRDGPMFYTLKTLPVSFTQIVGAKIFFCSIVAVLSIFVSCIILAAFSYVTVLETLFIFVVAILFAEAEICFATRKDLNHPTFSDDGDCEVKESNSTISTIIITGLIAATVIGGVSLYSSLIIGYNGGDSGKIFATIFVLLSVLILLGLTLTYLLVGLKKRFYEMTEGD